VQAQTKHLWLELCERAADEQNLEKFRGIVREIGAVLELKSRRLQLGRPQPAPPASDLLRCSLCRNPVRLDSAKTDENGKAVHEECYVLGLRLKQALIPPRA